ncbi:hypothetical protein BIW11_03138 [Tropilaelaps mercedesae]|uniref:Uncharacterized protein n=1 Tax=Tropilaelaps mercedesae TaxID=418985 RepID=A0A1V9XRN1_9ACAR|nr:hypothetical protein BIW11_03138 [Tropilaelaps mercedesae]
MHEQTGETSITEMASMIFTLFRVT